MESYPVIAKWTKEFGERVTAEFPFAKKVYLDCQSHFKNDLQLLESLARNPFLTKIQNKEELIFHLSQNPIFPLEKGIYCTLRQGYYTLSHNHIQIENCVAIFLFQREDIFQEFASKFPKTEEVQNISLIFPKKGTCKNLRNKVESFLTDILSEQNTLKLFLNYSTILSLETLDENSLCTLSNKQQHPDFFLRDSKLKLVFLFTSSFPLPVSELSQNIQDAVVYLGANVCSDYLYFTKIETDCPNLKIQILIVAEGEKL